MSVNNEELVKRWLLQLIERTPAEQLGELPLSWIVREAPGLVEGIAGELEAALAGSLARQGRNGSGRDPLTGLPGCEQLEEWLGALVAGQRRSGRPVAVLGMDITGLKHINEAHGRDAGDAVLASVGTMLRGQIRQVDRAFRLRADEFCVLAAEQEADQARPLALRLLRAVESLHSGGEPAVAVSIGIASCPRHGEDPRRLLGRATEARYAAKAAGENLAIAP